MWTEWLLVDKGMRNYSMRISSCTDQLNRTWVMWWVDETSGSWGAVEFWSVSLGSYKWVVWRAIVDVGERGSFGKYWSSLISDLALLVLIMGCGEPRYYYSTNFQPLSWPVHLGNKLPIVYHPLIFLRHMGEIGDGGLGYCTENGLNQAPRQLVVHALYGICRFQKSNPCPITSFSAG